VFPGRKNTWRQENERRGRTKEAAEAEAEGRLDSAAGAAAADDTEGGQEKAKEADGSPEPSPARRPRQYSGSDAGDVVTTQPTGEC